MGQTVREETAKDWDEATGNIAVPWLDFSAGDVYQSLMSAADSVGGALTFGKGYSVLMGMGAASSKAKELYERGASRDQIIAGSLLAGAAEIVFESLGIDGLLKAKNAKNLKDVVWNALKQSGVEAFEETGTEIANAISEVLVMDTQSKYGTLDWGDASTFASDVVNAALGGFISGGMGGGTMAAAGSAMQAADYQNAVKAHGQAISDIGGVESLQKHAEAMIKDKNTPNAWEIKQHLKKTQKNSSAKNVGNLYGVMQESVQKQNRKENVQQLKKEGLTKKQADAVYDAILQMEKNLSEGDSQRSTLTAWEGFVKAMEDLHLDDSMQHSVSLVAMDMVQNPQNASQTRLRDLMNARVGVDPQDVKTLSESLQKEIKTEGRVSSDGSTRLETTGETVQIDKENPIAKIEDDTVYLNTDHGVVETADLQFANEDELYLYEAVSGLDAGTAALVVTGYNGKDQTVDASGNEQKLSAQDYVQGMLEGILLYGKYNFQEVGADISEDGYFTGLSEADQQTALKLGRELRAEETRQKTERVRKAIERAKEEKKIRYDNAPVNQEILSLVDSVSKSSAKPNDSVFLGVVSDDIAAKIKELTGIDVEGFKMAIEARQIEHILKRHGEKGKANSSMEEFSDIAKIEYVLESPDDISRYGKTKAYTHMRNGRNKTADTVLYEKNIGEKSYYVVQAVPDIKSRTLYVVSAFIGKPGYKKEASQLTDANIPSVTSKNDSASASNNSIAQNSGIVKTEGKVFFDDSVEQSELTEKQRAEVEYAGNVISAVIGNEIHFFDSRHVPADSREARTNGWYDPKDGSIHLDIAKMENGEESVLFSLSHELVHFIEDWSPAKYQTFADFLLKNYAEHGVSTQELLERKMAELKTDDADHAMSELVADACERMLLDSKASEKLAELNKTDRGLVAKIKSFLANTLKKIRQAYAQFKGREESQLLQKMEDKLSEFHALFEDALTDAAQNYRAADGKLDAAEIREQAKRSYSKYGSNFHQNSEIYSYDFLTSQDSMKILMAPAKEDVFTNGKIDRDKVLIAGKKNALALEESSLGKDGAVSVINRYTKKPIAISEQSIKHGLGGKQSYFLTNARLGMIIGEIVQNGIPLNELTPSDGADSTYAIGAYVTSPEGRDFLAIAHIDVKSGNVVSYQTSDLVHSLRGRIKKGSPVAIKSAPASVENHLTVVASDISIAQFLEFVNSTNQSLLSNDVLKHFGETRKPEGNYYGEVKYQQKLSTTPRRVMANIIESTIDKNTPLGKKRLEQLKTYRENVAEFELTDKKVRQLSGKIAKYVSGETPFDFRDYDNLVAERNRLDIRRNQLEREFKRFESLPDVKEPLERELTELRKSVSEEQAKKAREMTRNAVKTRVEQIEQRDAKKKLYTLLRNTEKWINQPTKSQVHCPDVIKQPLRDLIKGIKGSKAENIEGDVWQISGALNGLAAAVEPVLNAQDDTSMEYISQGYLDLPDDFVQNLRKMATDIRGLAHEEDSKLHVVSELSAEEIKQLSKVIRQIRHSALEMQRLHTVSRFANAEEMGKATMAFLDALGKIDETSRIGNSIDWENVTPFYVFKRFGEGGLAIFNSFLDAHGKMARHAKTILSFQEKTWTKKESSEWEHQEILVDLQNGKKLRITAVEAMSIYCLSRRSQAERHLYGDGISIAGEKKGGKKKTDTEYKLQRADVKEIVKHLSKRQIEVADAIQQFFATECAEWGNEISMKRFLERRYTEQFYFPLETVHNKEAERSLESAAKSNNLYRLLNISATKDTDINAQNSVYVRNIFDVFASHSSDMARMNAFGMPLLDFMKWFNHVELATVDGKEIKTGSLRKSLGNAFGDIAENYAFTFIKDVNGSGDTAKESEFLMKMIRSYKTAAVGGNLRVAALQLTAYPKAAAVLDWKSLSAGSRPDNLTKIGYGIRQAEQYSGMAAWKFLGFYDTNVTRSIEAQIKDGKNLREKLIELSLKGAEWGDKITIGMLWNACEYEVQKKGNFEAGGEEFYQAVGQKLNEVIVQTQVVDSVVTRSQNMRKKTAMWQEATAFMSEPTLTHSIVEDCYWEFLLEKRRSGSASGAWKKTRKYIFKRLAPLTTTVLLATVVEMLFEDLRSDDDEEEKKPLEVVRVFLENLNPFNNVPILSNLMEAAGSAVWSFFGLETYEPSNELMSLEFLTTTWQAIQGWYSIIKNGSESDTTFYSALNNTVKAFSQTSGIPMSNAMREVVTLWNNIFKYVNPDLRIRTSKATSAEERKALYNAYVNGDAAQIERYRDNYDTDDKWTTAVRTALKENDPRIQQAAIAQLNGNASERVRIQKEIIGEGNFSQDLIVTATNGTVTSFQSKIRTASEAKKAGRVKEYEKIVKELQEAGYPDELISKYVGAKVEALQKAEEAEAEQGEKAASWYKSSDIADAYASGDEKLALEIITDLIRVKTANSTEEKAEDREKAAKSSVKSLVTEYWKPRYKEAYKKGNQEEMKRIRYILKDTGLYGSVNDLVKTCNRWTLEKEKNE